MQSRLQTSAISIAVRETSEKCLLLCTFLCMLFCLLRKGGTKPQKCLIDILIYLILCIRYLFHLQHEQINISPLLTNTGFSGLLHVSLTHFQLNMYSILSMIYCKGDDPHEKYYWKLPNVLIQLYSTSFTICSYRKMWHSSVSLRKCKAWFSEKE